MEYDTLYGKKYAYDGKNPYKATDFNKKMQGMKITDVLTKDEGDDLYVVLGNGFSEDCVVRINGMIVPTEYINSHTLQFKWRRYRPGDSVTVWGMDVGETEKYISPPKEETEAPKAPDRLVNN